MRTSFAAAASLLSLGTLVSAAVPIGKTCPAENLCYSINVPEAVATSGSGDIFFQISAPTTYSWAGLGQGSGMAGANMFVIYTSADGKNVTLSTRKGTGYSQPKHTTAVEAVLLEGSGVANGMMTANVKCSNCQSWDGGSMDFTSSSTGWLYASGSGSPMDTDALDAMIKYHGTSPHATFTWDLSSAKGGNTINPFVAAGTTGSGGNVSTAGGAGVTTTSTQTTSVDVAKYERLRLVHGTIAGLVFLGLLPIGGIIIRLFNFKGLIWVHAAIQTVGHLLYIVVFGLGVWMAYAAPLEGRAHPILGGIVFLIMFFQPLTGWLHHRFFKRAAASGNPAPKRAASSWVHLTSGRLIIVIGMINGGLGLWLAGVMGAGNIAWAVVAAVMGSLYIASIVIGERRRAKAMKELKSEVPAAGQSMEQVRPRDSEAAGSNSEVDSPITESHSAKFS